MQSHVSIDEQIEFFRRHGVTFDLMSEDEARNFLMYNSYFFKIKSYQKNYPQRETSEGYVYDGLDFAYLVELAALDFALSRLVLDLCASIEHSVKVRFNRELSHETDPDISQKTIQQFERFNSERFGSRDITDHIKSNPYTEELKNKRENNYSIWELWELMGFSDQLNLYNAYKEVTEGKVEKWHMLFVARKIRNAVSHGSCLFADLNRKVPTASKNKRGDKTLTRLALDMCDRPITRGGKRRSFIQVALSQLVVHNYAAVLICHLSYVESTKILRYTCTDIERFISRVERNLGTYFGNIGKNYVRNPLVNSTLQALVTLSQGYIKKAQEKIEDLNKSTSTSTTDNQERPSSGNVQILHTPHDHLFTSNRFIHSIQRYSPINIYTDNYGENTWEYRYKPILL